MRRHQAAHRGPVPRLLPLLALPLLLPGTAHAQVSAQGGTQEPLHAELLPRHLAERTANLAYFDLAELVLPQDVEERFELAVSCRGTTFDLELQKASVRSADFRAIEVAPDGREVEVEPGPIRTFRGRVAQDKGAVVVGSMLPTGMELNVSLSDGRRILVEPHYEAFLNGDRSEFLVYESSELPEAGGVCATTEPQVPVDTVSEAAGFEACGGDFCVAELALDCDFSFYEYWNSSVPLTLSAAEYIALVANVQYLRDVEIQHQVSAILVRSAGDPVSYTLASNGTLLPAMRDHWNNFHATIERDLAHLLTRRLAGGQAYVGAVCGASAYGINGTQSDQLVRIANVLAHEMGHNWNAEHCDCDGAPNPAYTMHAFFPPTPLRFNPANTIPDIRAFRDTRTCLRPGVIHDNREDALEAAPGLVRGDTFDATNDGTSSCTSTIAPDVWHVYRPAVSGTLTVSSCRAATMYNTSLSIQRTDGTEIACNDSDPSCTFGGTRSTVSASVAGGEAYYIRVAGFGVSRGRYELEITGPPVVAPANDAFADAMHIGPGVHFGSTGAASASAEGSSACGSSSGSPDVWYSYTPDRSGWTTVDTCRPSEGFGFPALFDTVLSVHDSAGALIACNDDFCERSSRVELSATAGARYLIRVSGFNGANGGFRLNLSGPRVRNDDCGGALDVGEGTLLATFQGAYESDGISSCFGGSNRPDIFYSYRNSMDCDGVLTVSTCGTFNLGGTGTGVDTLLTIYDDCPAGGSSQITCNDDSFFGCNPAGLSPDARSSVLVEAGESVIIRVSPVDLATGRRKPFLLNTNFQPIAPANDSCQDALLVTEGPIAGTTCGASADGPASCDFGEPADVWFSYTAPNQGTLTAHTCGTSAGIGNGANTVVSLFAPACPVTAADQLACNPGGTVCGTTGSDDASVQYPIAAGETVLIRVSTFSPFETTPFVLWVDLELGNNYCTLTPNSQTSGARISAAGSPSLAQQDFTLIAEDAPSSKPGLFFLGPNQIASPFGEGRRCVGGQTKRIAPIATTDGSGRATRTLDFSAPYATGIFIGGSGVNYQFWFRDPGDDSDGDGTIEGFNLTDAINVVHTP